MITREFEIIAEPYLRMALDVPVEVDFDSLEMPIPELHSPSAVEHLRRTTEARVQGCCGNIACQAEVTIAVRRRDADSTPVVHLNPTILEAASQAPSYAVTSSKVSCTGGAKCPLDYRDDGGAGDRKPLVPAPTRPSMRAALPEPAAAQPELPPAVATAVARAKRDLVPSQSPTAR